MPVSFSSPPRNLFLFGSSGAQVVTNFFKQIDEASSGDYFHTPSEIRYVDTDGNYIIGGQGDRTSPATQKFGWIDKKQEDGTEEWSTEVQSTIEGASTTLTALELDGSGFVAVGKSGGFPWIAKYTDGGAIEWTSTSNSGDVEYTGVTVDTIDDFYFACGHTSIGGESIAFIDSFSANGDTEWGKAAHMVGRDVVLNDIATQNGRGQVVAVGYLEDDSANKGYIIKMDTTTGEIVWDRTLELNIPAANIELTAIDVDNNDEIYVCGNIKYQMIGPTIPPVDGFIAKYTAEGNLLWQSQSDYASGTGGAVYYEDITIDNTTKKPTTFGYTRYAVANGAALISRYEPDGSLSWRREIDEGNSFDPRNTSVDGDQSFIYLLFNDPADTETYVYGKVSATGNGLGDFEYNDGTGAPLLQYTTTSGTNGSGIEEKIGRLSDGSVRNDTSDLLTYPFNANKLLFDDLATHVTNKRRQMDDADSFEYSGSPAVRIVDFQELNLLGENNFVGPELITNGTFDSDTNSWEAYDDGVLSVSSGRLRVTSNDTVSGFNYLGIANQFVPTVIGKSYRFSVDVTQGNDTARIRIDDDTYWQSSYYNQSGVTTGTVTVDFIATTTTTSISLSPNSGTIGNYCDFDNVELKEIAWVDQSGKSNDGAVVGPTHSGTGYWEFDGTDDEITIDTFPDLSNVTVEWWGTSNNPTINYKTPVMRTTNSSWTDGFGFYQYDGTLAFWINAWNGGQSVTTSETTFGFTHWVGTYDGSNLKLYKNGSLVTTGAAYSTAMSNPNVSLDIGHSQGNYNWTGNIGEVRIYRRALTEEQVFQNYNASKQKYINELAFTGAKVGPGIVTDSNLSLYYDFGNRHTWDGSLETVQNLYRHSQELHSNTYWGLSNIDTVKDAAIAPDGTKTADLLIARDTNAGHVIKPNILIDTVYHTVSIFLKDAGDRYFTIRGDNQSNWVTFDLVDGVISSDSTLNSTISFIQDMSDPAYGWSAGDGWYRCGISYIPALTGNDPEFFLVDSDNYLGTAFTGSGTGGVYVWGAQLEKGFNVTEYLRTFGSEITPPTTVKNLTDTSIPGTIDATYPPTFNADGYFDFGTTSEPKLISTIGTNCSTLLGSGDCSIECWVKFDDTFTRQTILSGYLSGDGARWDLEVVSGSITFIHHVNGSTTQNSGGVSTTSWTHIALTNSASSFQLYINGSANGSLSFGSSMGSNVPLGLGCRADGSTNFPLDGQIAEVRTYTKKLISAEVSQNFNATRAKYGV